MNRINYHKKRSYELPVGVLDYVITGDGTIGTVVEIVNTHPPRARIHVHDVDGVPIHGLHYDYESRRTTSVPLLQLRKARKLCKYTPPEPITAESLGGVQS